MWLSFPTKNHLASYPNDSSFNAEWGIAKVLNDQRGVSRVEPCHAQLMDRILEERKRVESPLQCHYKMIIR